MAAQSPATGTSRPKPADATRPLFPEVRSVLQDMAEMSIPGRLRRALFLRLLSLAGTIRHCERSRQRMIEVAQQGINPFERDTVSRNFRGLYPELSFTALLGDGDSDPFVRAAKLVCAALEYKDFGPGDTNTGSIAGGNRIERRESHLFGRAVSVFRRTGVWRKWISEYPESDYIVVAASGQFFALTVYENGVAIGWERLACSLREIVKCAREKNAARGYGALTAVVNAATAALVHNNSTAPGSVQVIDAALFLLALDLEAAPDDVNTMGMQLQMAGYQNRDYRKSFQLVVLGSGKAGAVFNLLGGVEGVTAAHFISAISARAATIPPSGETIRPVPFRFVDVPGEPPLVKEAEARIRKAMCSVYAIHRIDTMSKDRMKNLGVSPDAFFHAAAHLAWSRRFGRTAEAHNFIDLRMLRFGSISRYPSTTDAMRSFLRSRTRTDLLRALRAHKEAIAEVQSGHHPLHYIYHYVFASPGAAALLAVVLFTLCIPGFLERFLSPDLWLSNIPALPGVDCVCRMGVTLSFLRKQAYTGHYLLFPDHIVVCFLARDEEGVRAWDVKRELEGAFRDLETILSGTD